MTDTPSKPQVKKRYYTRLMDLYRYSPVPLGFLNPVIRSVFTLKSKKDMRAVEANAISDAEVAEWYDGHDVFFGFCINRSGSTFMADFLNEALDDAIVQHEANVVDYYDYPNALQDPQAARDYIDRFRRKEIVLRLSSHECRVYGEINPFLRRHCEAVRHFIPSARMFLLVRDGRKVLRSLMSRELLAPNDPMGKLVRPGPADPYAAEWEQMSRFERLCWMWQADNRFVRENSEFVVQFERLTSDYGYFERFMERLGLAIDEATWARRTARTTNPTPRQTFPPYDSWSAADKAAFERICGDEMSACGY